MRGLSHIELICITFSVMFSMVKSSIGGTVAGISSREPSDHLARVLSLIPFRPEMPLTLLVCDCCLDMLDVISTRLWCLAIEGHSAMSLYVPIFDSARTVRLSPDCNWPPHPHVDPERGIVDVKRSLSRCSLTALSDPSEFLDIRRNVGLSIFVWSVPRTHKISSGALSGNRVRHITWPDWATELFRLGLVPYALHHTINCYVWPLWPNQLRITLWRRPIPSRSGRRTVGCAAPLEPAKPVALGRPRCVSV